MNIKSTYTTITNLLPSTFSGNLKLTAGIVTILAIVFPIYVWSEKQIDKTNNLRHKSDSLVNELRQSSNDLTNMVRTYVVTGNPFYKKYYQDILDTRNGKIPRPANYNLAYWDLVLTGEKSPGTDASQAIALLELMKQAGFPAQELQKLTESKVSSDKLTEIEFNAMALVESSASNDIVSKSEALTMLHDVQYYRAKAGIMRPINEVISMMDKRTADAVQNAEALALNLRILLIGFALSLIFTLMRFHSILKAQLDVTQREVPHEISKIVSADIAMRDSQAAGKNTYTLSILQKQAQSDAPWINLDVIPRLGVSIIDEQHLNIINMLNVMNDAIKHKEPTKRLMQLLDELISFTAYHFKTEERLMHEYGYPAEIDHQNRHDHLLHEAAYLKTQFMKGGELVFLQKVKDWFAIHITTEDKPLADFILQHDAK